MNKKKYTQPQMRITVCGYDTLLMAGSTVSGNLKGYSSRDDVDFINGGSANNDPHKDESGDAKQSNSVWSSWDD